jgi:hypothetical protein
MTTVFFQLLLLKSFFEDFYLRHPSNAIQMKSLNPGLTAEQCRKILRDTSYPLEFEGKQAPRVLDALAALQKAKNYTDQ